MLFSDEFQGSSSLEAHQLALDREVGLHDHPRRPSTIWRSIPMRRSRHLAVGLLAASLGSAAADTPAPTVSPARPFALEGVFQTADRPPARDLSGIACKPAPEGVAQRLCLVVNDRDRFAQIATLTNGGITPGPTVVLLGARPSETVPMAELPNPTMRSPSQWPCTARSSASAGRWLIRISGAMPDLPRPRLRARGTRSARPVRRQAVSSRRSAPRPC